MSDELRGVYRTLVSDHRVEYTHRFIEARDEDGKPLDLDYIKAEILLVLLAGKGKKIKNRRDRTMRDEIFSNDMLDTPTTTKQEPIPQAPNSKPW